MNRPQGVRGLLIYCADYRCSHSPFWEAPLTLAPDQAAHFLAPYPYAGLSSLAATTFEPGPVRRGPPCGGTKPRPGSTSQEARLGSGPPKS